MVMHWDLPGPDSMHYEHFNCINKLIGTWYNSNAHKMIGPLWSFATDSDATQRRAGHKIFMASKLTSLLPLFGTLCGLSGLNLHTGPYKMTMDFDYKHILKHKFFC